jgi:hypothetical protein
MKRNILFFLSALFLTFLSPLPLNAQPTPGPCKPFIFCQVGCLEDGETCWDIHDPVPLDNGLIALVVAGIFVGLYKIRSVKQLQG